MLDLKNKIYALNMLFFEAFAFCRSYALLFFARAVQGIGSACSSVAGKLKLDLF